MTRKLILSAALAGTAAFAAAGTAFAQDGPGRGMDGHRGDRPIFGFLCLLALAAVAIVATWLIIRRRPAAAAVSVAPNQPATANAEAILAERLARSEISADDYRTTLSALRGTPLGATVESPPTE